MKRRKFTKGLFIGLGIINALPVLSKAIKANVQDQIERAQANAEELAKRKAAGHKFKPYKWGEDWDQAGNDWRNEHLKYSWVMPCGCKPINMTNK